MNARNEGTAGRPIFETKTDGDQEKRIEATSGLHHSMLNTEAGKLQEYLTEEEGAIPEQDEATKGKLVPKKRVQRVAVEDVKELGYELNLCLRTKGFTFEGMDKVFKDVVVNIINLSQLRQRNHGNQIM